jgi:hypothetical protein
MSTGDETGRMERGGVLGSGGRREGEKRGRRGERRKEGGGGEERRRGRGGGRRKMKKRTIDLKIDILFIIVVDGDVGLHTNDSDVYQHFAVHNVFHLKSLSYVLPCTLCIWHSSSSPSLPSLDLLMRGVPPSLLLFPPVTCDPYLLQRCALPG